MDENKELKNGRQLVLVVGGAGYLGSVLVNKLLDRGYNVRVLDILMFGEEPINQFKGRSRFEFIRGDVRNIETISKAIDGVNAVIHLAAVVGDKACSSLPDRTVETNYLATRILAEACRYHQINRFIYASTCSVYGVGDGLLLEDSPPNPLSLYATTKLKSEQAILELQDDNFTPCIMRMATLHGWSPRMRFDLVVNTMTMHAVTKGTVMVHGGKQWRPQLHIEDAAEGYINVLEAPLERIRGQVFNMGDSDKNIRILGIAELVMNVLPRTVLQVKDNLEDERDYRVSFAKIRDTLNYRTTFSIGDSITTIAQSLSDGLIQDPYQKNYYNYFEV